MKIIKLFYTISIVLLLSSCATKSFYQVYNVKSLRESITNSDELFFEDENCKISYNLWANGGNIGFDFYNKTDNNIYVKLNESNFILNGFAYDYFKNRTYTTTTGSATITGMNIYNDIQTIQVKSHANLSSSVGYSVSIIEDSIICIPSKTTKRISEYLINNALIRNCDVFKYPKSNEIKSKSYTVEQSPLVFSNRITYEINGISNKIENDFFVSEITNYPESEFFEWKYDEYCDQKSSFHKKHYQFYGIDKFYLEYSKGTDYWKH